MVRYVLSVSRSIKCASFARFISAGLILGTFASLVYSQSTQSQKPLEIFILAGQSNMQGHANIKTIPTMESDPKTRGMLKDILKPNGQPRLIKNVWIASIGCGGNEYNDLISVDGQLTTGFGASRTEIGTELTFGIYMEKALHQPILIIKTSWGGRSLMTDFRPPSAGPRVYGSYIRNQWKARGLNPDQEIEKTNAQCGVYYKDMMDYVHHVLNHLDRYDPQYNPRVGYRLGGFVWFQGFNDMIDGWSYPHRMQPGGYSQYKSLLVDLIHDVRLSLKAPKLPFVIGVMGVDGNPAGQKPPQKYFREAEVYPSTLSQFKGNVVAVHTAHFWDDHLYELVQRKDRLRQKVNALIKLHPDWSPKQKRQSYDQAKAIEFTPKELEELQEASNGDYHYLGAAKIIAPIGKAFADAMIGMERHSPKPRIRGQMK